MEMVRGKWAVRVLRSSLWNITKAAVASNATMMPGTTNLFTAPTSAQILDGREVLDVRVEPGSRAEGVGEDPVERRHQPQAVVEVVLVLVEHVEHVLQMGQRGLQVGPALPHQ